MEEIVTILIADDNWAIIDFIKSYIEKDDRYKIIGICCDAEEQIKMIDKLKPDIVITDIKKNNEFIGLEIIKKYKAEEYCPIFYVVSASIGYYISELRDLKVRYYIQKPFEVEDFMRILGYAYNEIFPKEIVVKKQEIEEPPKRIFAIFDTIKKRIGV